MKHEWRKQEKKIYGTKGIPCVIDFLSQKFITISGTGNPKYCCHYRTCRNGVKLTD